MDDKMTGLLEEYIKEFDPENIMEAVKGYFRKEHHFAAEHMEWNNVYRYGAPGGIFDNKENVALTHMDKLPESATMAFFLKIFQCFLEGGTEQEQISFAKACYRTIFAFYYGHKIARACQKMSGMTYREGEELVAADGMAYDIVLRMTGTEENGQILLDECAFPAPIMYLDFLDLLFYTQRSANMPTIYHKTHPIAMRRREQMINMCDLPGYRFDRTRGSRLYCRFIDVYDRYKIDLVM